MVSRHQQARTISTDFDDRRLQSTMLIKTSHVFAGSIFLSSTRADHASSATVADLFPILDTHESAQPDVHRPVTLAERALPRPPRALTECHLLYRNRPFTGRYCHTELASTWYDICGDARDEKYLYGTCTEPHPVCMSDGHDSDGHHHINCLAASAVSREDMEREASVHHEPTCFLPPSPERDGGEGSSQDSGHDPAKAANLRRAAGRFFSGRRRGHQQLYGDAPIPPEHEIKVEILCEVGPAVVNAFLRREWSIYSASRNANILMLAQGLTQTTSPQPHRTPLSPRSTAREVGYAGMIQRRGCRPRGKARPAVDAQRPGRLNSGKATSSRS